MIDFKNNLLPCMGSTKNVNQKSHLERFNILFKLFRIVLKIGKRIWNIFRKQRGKENR